MNNNVFRRIEEKYLLTEEQYKKLFENINEFIEQDKYFKTTICNIYFDNEDNELIVHSMEKPLYKVKVRLRSYGVPKLNDNVFLEIKSKYRKIVGKRRIKLSLKEFNNYLEKGIYDQNDQIMKEIDYLFKLYGLKPSYFIGYDRISYREIGNSDLRITIDRNLRSRTNNLKLENGDNGKKYFDKEVYLMEIKTLDSMPLWLVRNLSELKIFPASFSKYGSIYQKDKEECIC